MLKNTSLAEVLDAFASSAPTPGGGSAAALAGALGASLLAMVAGLPKGKSETAEDRQLLDDARAKLLECQRTLIDLIDRDAAAYDRVVAAYRLPKVSDAEKEARKAAVQDALEHATEVPLETLETSSEALKTAETVVRRGNPSAASDVAVGFQLLTAGIQGALLNVEVNLQSVTDVRFTETVTERIKASTEHATPSFMTAFQSSAVGELMQRVSKRLGGRGHGSMSSEAAKLAGPTLPDAV